MERSADDWSRPYFKPGGGDAQLHYVVFGDFETVPVVSATKHRSAGIPEGIDVRRFDATQEGGPFDLLEGPFLDLLLETDAALRAPAVASPHAIVVAGTVHDPETLEYLRDVIGLVTALADAGVVVADLHTLAWYAPSTWRRAIFEPGGADLSAHVALLGSEDESAPEPGTLWLHTRGLRKFGRADLGVHGVTPALRGPVVEVVQRLIGLQVRGGRIPDGQAVKLAGIPDGTRCVHGGALDDPDYNNVHVDVVLGG